MTDREFMDYLFDLLLGKGEYCRKCAYNVSDRELCENCKSGELKTSVCVDGIREYAERNACSKTAVAPRK